MKYLSPKVFYVVAFTLWIGAGCDDDKVKSDPVIEDQTANLTGAWKVSSVTADDVAISGWEAFTLTIAPVKGAGNLSYLITNNPYKTPWVAVTTGHFTFAKDDPEKFLVREDGVRIQYDVTEESLALAFTYHGTEGWGRVSGVGGAWRFVFQKL